MKNNQTLRVIGVLILLLAIGIGIIAMNKFQYNVNYSKNVRLEIYLGKNFETNDILAMARNIYENQEVVVQKAGVFQDSIAITVKSVEEEQNAELISKINEKYETELTVEDIDIYYNSNVRGRDLIEPYLLVSTIAGLLILVFFAVRYYRLGILRVIGSLIGVGVGTQILYLTLMSICNMPVNSITIVSGIAILIFCMMYLSANYEKALKK